MTGLWSVVNNLVIQGKDLQMHNQNLALRDANQDIDVVTQIKQDIYRQYALWVPVIDAQPQTSGTQHTPYSCLRSKGFTNVVNDIGIVESCCSKMRSCKQNDCGMCWCNQSSIGDAIG